MGRVSEGAAIADRIRVQLRGFRENEQGRRVIERLAGSADATEALAEMHLTDVQLREILLFCIEAYEHTQTFKSCIDGEKRALELLGKLDSAVEMLRRFVKEISEPPTDRLSASIRVPPEERQAYLMVLRNISGLIDLRRRVAVETPRRIGATRKCNRKEAAEDAGIGYLAQGIKHVMGKPYYAQTGRLSEVLLSCGDVGMERVRQASRNASREWRQWRVPMKKVKIASPSKL